MERLKINKYRVFLSLGSNLGKRLSYLNQAILALENEAGHVIKQSSLFETEPWGFVAKNKFLNMAIELETNQEPGDLLQTCLMIEKSLGRERSKNNKYESRTIDIDILFFDNLILDFKALQVPHPKLHLRRFVLEPLNEIAPDFIHPALNCTIQLLLERCIDRTPITKSYTLNKLKKSRESI